MARSCRENRDSIRMGSLEVRRRHSFQRNPDHNPNRSRAERSRLAERSWEPSSRGRSSVRCYPSHTVHSRWSHKHQGRRARSCTLGRYSRRSERVDFERLPGTLRPHRFHSQVLRSQSHILGISFSHLCARHGAVGAGVMPDSCLLLCLTKSANWQTRPQEHLRGRWLMATAGGGFQPQQIENGVDEESATEKISD